MRYSSYGNRDSQHAVDGDMSFVRMVTRLNPEQLQPGEVAFSQNGRMDNNRRWEPRKGGSLVGDSGATSLAIAAYTDSTDSTYILSHGTNYIQAFRGSGSSSLTNIRLYTPSTLSGVTRGSILPYQDGILLFNGADSVPMKLEGDLAPESISNAYRTSNVVTVNCSPHTFVTGDAVSVHGTSGFSTSINGRWVIASTPTSASFTFSQTASDEGSVGSPISQDSNAAGVARTFSAVSTSATVATSDDDVSMVVSSGACDITATSHGRSKDDVVTVYDGGGSGLVEGDKYQIDINVAAGGGSDTNNYHFYAEIPDGTYTVTLGGKQPLSGGYIAMPRAPWGVIHENRLVLPYDPSGSAGNTDELIFSDIFGYETFDPIVNQMRFGIRADDYIQDYIPITADRAVVLCRHSIHLVVGISGSLLDISRYEITREVGCLSRGGAVFMNGSIIFLSRYGISKIAMSENYELFVEPIPLSEPIGNTFKTFLELDDDVIARSFLRSHQNRLYCFLSSTPAYPFEALIYNFENQGWESYDTYTAYLITDAVSSNNGSSTYGIFVQDQRGEVFKLEENDALDDTISSTAAISAYVKTRGYDFGNLNDKHFTRASILGIDSNATTVTVSAEVTDPDSSTTFYTTSDLTTDSNIRQRIRVRGRMVQLKYSAASGGLRGCSVSAWLQSMGDVTRA